jgi:hypothetical protein
MNASALSEVPIEPDHEHEKVRTRSADPVSTAHSLNEPKQLLNAVRLPVFDDTTFQSFINGSGI